jgi:2-polyprenyl-3-methyl-5-hydroxy-6-metoxy-1,4-benzoquinol methylase
MKCRFCKTPLEHSFIDLGFAPPSNSYLTREDLSKPEIYYPLRVKVCDQCWLVQTEDFASKHEFFNDEYAYFSSTSKSWCEHAKKYVHMIVPRLGLSEKSLVIEIASNDGYLLEHFGPLAIPCLGIEPTLSTALEAEKKGIEVIKEFFTVELSKDLVDKYGKADLIIGNNVFAHVPDILDFSIAMKNALKSDGVITLEFPHLLELIKNNQFDTIYHEHYSYLSLLSVTKILAAAKLKIYDVEQVSTHGGSLRIFCAHVDSNKNISSAVHGLLKEEIDQGLDENNYIVPGLGDFGCRYFGTLDE